MRCTYIRITVMIIALIGMSQFYGCNSTWDDAKQANTYQSYQTYIKNNPHGKHLAEAKKQADARYWESIKNDSTAAAFKTYLNKFPEGQFQSQAKAKINHITLRKSDATQARVTGSNVIIRSDHTTASSTAGVVAKKGTIVQILDQYNSGNSGEAILKRPVTVDVHHVRINLVKGKAIRILSDRDDSVRASFSTSEFGMTEAVIKKADIEAMGGQKWYKIHTTDNITGWIYGKFIEEL